MPNHLLRIVKQYVIAQHVPQNTLWVNIGFEHLVQDHHADGWRALLSYGWSGGVGGAA